MRYGRMIHLYISSRAARMHISSRRAAHAPGASAPADRRAHSCSHPADAAERLIRRLALLAVEYDCDALGSPPPSCDGLHKLTPIPVDDRHARRRLPECAAHLRHRQQLDRADFEAMNCIQSRRQPAVTSLLDDVCDASSTARGDDGEEFQRAHVAEEASSAWSASGDARAILPRLW
eukprot:CAMPEP_0119397994 /NCGR_PEP_ID=MMETSP1334-20130426/140614_1 /TAXON_ID=127549 /ORGANISM="Calcidiscus leptoporus, Strain RCC1130" /LENGTH=176 /DNA_ID=CAMNT_0007421845 /DNA_START=1942 /DNA_END=2472 /DNA_ORIENTATION=-